MTQERKRPDTLPDIKKETANQVLKQLGIDPQGASIDTQIPNSVRGHNMAVSEFAYLLSANNHLTNTLFKVIREFNTDSLSDRNLFQQGIAITSRSFSTQLNVDYFGRIKKLSPASVRRVRALFARHRLTNLTEHDMLDEAAATPPLPPNQEHLERCLFFAAHKIGDPNNFARLQLGGKVFYKVLAAELIFPSQPERLASGIPSYMATLDTGIIVDPTKSANTPN